MIHIKSKNEIQIMKEGGLKLADIKKQLRRLIVPGNTPLQIDKEAESLILKAHGTPSFKMVKNYKWTTCININDGVVHGIPDNRPFLNGDVVSLDIGIFYKGFHNDSAFTVVAGVSTPVIKKFLDVGKHALNESIKKAKIGNKVSDISQSMHEVLASNNYSPVYDLTGHGVGRELHEEPTIPCYYDKNQRAHSPVLSEGMVIAIEVIYTIGSPDLRLDTRDGWTISTKDGKIAGLFEETIAVVPGTPFVLSA